MGCTHPDKLVRRVVREDGVPGIRCVRCGAISFHGDSWWDAFKRDFFGVFGDRADENETLRYSDAVE